VDWEYCANRGEYYIPSETLTSFQNFLIKYQSNENMSWTASEVSV
jgi:hypothetical protein